ncbi:MAG: drug/metabolite transporter (DMT)-like permease [Planctomycetota bacterium]|jgi:drug/metabolite transporter (DMT)-like permease
MMARSMTPPESTTSQDPELSAAAAARSGHLALLVVQVMFGLFPVFGTLAFAEGGFEPLGVASWRLLTGGIVLGGLAAGVYGRSVFPARRDIPRLALCGFFGIALNQGLYLTGLERSTPANAGLIICLVPVFTYGIAAGIGQERFGARRALGIGLAFIGLCPLFMGRGATLIGEFAVGNAMIATNALSYAIYLVISKPLVKRYPPLVVIAWSYLFSLPSLLLFLPSASMMPQDPSNSAVWWSLAFVLAFPTVLAYLLNIFALSRVPASTTAFYIYLQPLLAVGVSWWLLGEQLTPQMASAGLGLFLAVFLVSKPGKRRDT